MFLSCGTALLERSIKYSRLTSVVPHSGSIIKGNYCCLFHSVMAKTQQSPASTSVLCGDKAVLVEYLSKMEYKSEITDIMW